MQNYVMSKYVRNNLTRLTFYAYRAEYGDDPNKYIKSLPLFTVDLWCDAKNKFTGTVVQHHTEYRLTNFNADLMYFVWEEIKKVTGQK